MDRNWVVQRLLDVREGKAPMHLPRVDRSPVVEPRYAIWEHELNVLLDAIATLERERDEALDRAEELEAYQEKIADEFEKDLWVEVRDLLAECEFDWSDVGPDGVTASEAGEHIRETLRAQDRFIKQLRGASHD